MTMNLGHEAQQIVLIANAGEFRISRAAGARE
jgi:hypothetical protein